MSLVAYDASSGDESEDNEEQPQTSFQQITASHKQINGHISDDEDYPTSEDHKKLSEDPVEFLGKSFLKLPAPKTLQPEENVEESIEIPFEKLPAPKKATETVGITEEEDEFLHKKAMPEDIEKPPPPTVRSKGPVRITIPSLSDFKDVSSKPQKPAVSSVANTSKFSLLTLLPKPKSEALSFAGPNPKSASAKTTTSLVPDSVKNRQQAPSTSGIGKGSPQKGKKKSVAKNVSTSLIGDYSDSDDNDENESGDFFSLASEEKLPQVSDNEIQAMVRSRAAKMAEMSLKIDEMVGNRMPDQNEIEDQVQIEQNAYENRVAFDDQAMQALVGSKAKRRKVEKMNIVELSSAQVLPDKDEWLRTALASSTEYQAKGILQDEEPVPGTRKKHQITYLAHQAKTNEAELQAMWAANRHTRRQTQSKYGF